MALKNKSEVSTIDNPEFINLAPSDISPLISTCEIKVFYLGRNRNHSYINKETALKMAKTLRGTPIVAAYNKDKEDFGDHGQVVHIEDGEISFSCKTVPYGFISPDAEVWFQNFTDIDEFDNKVERTYMMTTGYLWTGQFPELTKVIEEGQPHSMELDGESLDGHWAEDSNSGISFFIINDATFSKLCILGDNVEPCYEGSSVISPQVSSNFTKQEFGNTLFAMMQELKNILNNNEGGLDMDNDVQETFEEVTPIQEETTFEQEEVVSEEVASDDEVQFDNDVDSDAETDEDKDDSEDAEEDKEEEENNNSFTLEQFEALNNEVESLRAEIQELREFKLQVENQRKQAIIDKYFMLSDEDKKDIVENMANYSLDEINAKLALKYVEQNVDFTKVDDQSNIKPSPEVTFSLEEETDTETLTDLQRALREAKN